MNTIDDQTAVSTAVSMDAATAVSTDTATAVATAVVTIVTKSSDFWFVPRSQVPWLEGALISDADLTV